jgi:hypothetical protein
VIDNIVFSFRTTAWRDFRRQDRNVPRPLDDDRF